MFCPECGSILRPKQKGSKRVLFCSCGYSKAPEEGETAAIKETAEERKRIEVIEKIEMHPKIKAKCPKCAHEIAYFWTQQTRGADEPETRFFKCVKCEHTWREYA